MKNFVTPHCHQSSLDTGSTPVQFLAREVELDTGYTTVTDHGTLQAAREVFDLAKKKKYTPIIGLEAYFRDDDCPIIKASGFPKGTRYRNPETGSWKSPEEWEKLPDREKVKYLPEEGFWNYRKYFHLTMHFLDAEAYETAVKLLSAADARAEQHGSERKPLFAWKELEELGSKNVVFGSGCLIGMVQGHLMAQDNWQMAWQYYEHLRSIVKPGNFFVEAFPHVCTHYYQDKVVITFEDGTEEAFPSWKNLKTNAGAIKAKELAQAFNAKGNDHETLFEVMQQRKWLAREGKVMKSVRRDEGFVENDCHPWSTGSDVQKDCNKFMLAIAKAHGDPVLVSDDSHYAHPDEKIVQDVRLASSGGWRFFGHYHRQSSAEAWAYFKDELGVPEATFEQWVENSYAWAERFKGFTFNERLSLPTRFYPQDTVSHVRDLIRKHGRLSRDPVYMERLYSELRLLNANGKVDLLPYFFVAEEVCAEYEKHALLTGPGRGSAAGLLLSYLLGITHVDPLKYALSQERFLTLDRIKGGKFPDIDQDLPGRDLLINPETGWLRQRFGDCYAQISTDTKLKLRSSVKDVARMKFGHVPEDIEKLTAKFKKPPQGIEDHDFVHGYKDADDNLQPGSIDYDDALKEYIRKYPKQWEIVDRCLGLARQKSRHACGYVITNEPVSNFIPLTSVSDVTVTQYTAKSVEAVGGLKMDYLVVNSLNDIADAIKLIQEHLGYTSKEDVYLDGRRVPWFRVVPFEGKLYDIWDLPQHQAVFRDICEGKTETVFQFNTDGAKKWLREFNRVRYIDADGETHKALDTDEALAAFTALDRPGPLDYHVGADEAKGIKGHNMLVEYAHRAAGQPATGAMPILDKLLPETYGVIVYQEQLQAIFQKVGKTTALEADAFRTHISKKEMEKVYKDKAIFMRGAVEDLGEDVANTLWSSMETFGKYGFNKSHAVCYASKIGYACAWLKHHYKLQWWCSVLRNADKNEVNEDFWPYCGKLVLMPDVSKSGKFFQVEGDRIRAPINLLSGIGEKAHEQLMAGFPYQDIQDFCTKIQAHRLAGASEVTVKNKKTGLEKKKLKLGRSALTRKVVGTLIQSGTMDSLFPEGTSLHGKLTAFEDALVAATGCDRNAVDPKTLDLSPLVVYQMRKAVLPVYSEDLVPVLVRLKVDDVYYKQWENVNGQVSEHAYTRMRYTDPDTMADEYTDVVLVDGQTMQFMNADPEVKKNALAAVVGYVKETRKFNYGGGDKGPKTAIEVVIDVGGFDHKFVRWPGRSGRLDSKYTEEGLRGGIVVAVVTKYDPKKPFCIEDLRIVQEPLNLKGEESSSAPKEK